MVALFIRIEKGTSGSWYLERCVCWLPKDEGEEEQGKAESEDMVASSLPRGRREQGEALSSRLNRDGEDSTTAAHLKKPRKKVAFPCYAWFGCDLGLTTRAFCRSYALK